MEKTNLKPIAKNKIVGVIFMIISVFGFLIIAHRLSYYVYEYDPQFSPVDYGKYNILSYFTVQSNFFVYVYLLIASLGIFGNKKAQKAAFNPLAGTLITTYIILTGLVYCCGIPLGFTPPFKWYDAPHAMSSFIQVFYHMIVPPFMVLIWFFPFTDRKIPHRKCLALVGIYPLVYSIFSIIRGAFSNPQYYPYPFYNPQFIWDLVFKDKPINLTAAYLMMIPLLIVGILLFVLMARLVILINDKRR